MGAPFWLRYGLGGLSQFSPGKAATLANRFFRRPGLASGYSAEDLKRLAIAEEVLAKGERRVTTLNGRRLVSHHFAPGGASKGIILLLHGWSGDSRAMAAFPEAITAAGFTAVSVDLPAHGASDGEETDVLEAANAVSAFLAAHSIRPDHIIAHSFGGAVASLLAADGMQPTSLVSVSAPTSFALVIREVAQAFNLSPKAEACFAAHVGAALGLDPEHLDAAPIWRDAMTDILILHAPDDARVSFEHARRFADLPNARLQKVHGPDHCAIIYAPETVAAALDHIQQADAASAARRWPEVA